MAQLGHKNHVCIRTICIRPYYMHLLTAVEKEGKHGAFFSTNVITFPQYGLRI